VEILIKIAAPTFGKTTIYDQRRAQWERNCVGGMLRLLADRLGYGQAEGTISQDCVTLRWQTEQSTPAQASDAKDAAA
jgi:hypothetical protein